MTITCNCPKCGQFCGFKDHHKGRRARCTKCQQAFFIPGESGQKPKIPKTIHDKPLPGFYKSALKENWKIFIDLQNITPLVFIAAMVCFRFFLGHTDYSFSMPGFRIQIPTGLIIVIFTWGSQIWYYMEIIQYTTLNMKTLPDIEITPFFNFLGGIFVSIYLFLVAVVIAEIPFFIIIALLKMTPFHPTWLLQILTLGGALLFPAIIFIFSTGRAIWLVFRFDYLVKPLIKSFRPYCVLALMLIIAAAIQWSTKNYGQTQNVHVAITALHLVLNLIATAFTLIAMRAIGLFAFHYQCYMPPMIVDY